MSETSQIQARWSDEGQGAKLDPRALSAVFGESLRRMGADPETVQRCLDVAANLFDAIDQPPSGALRPWQITRVRDYIDDQLDGRITLAGAAEQARLGPSHFSRCFRLCFGVTFLKYVAQKRVERAQRLLVKSPSQLSDIALVCGFADQAHFTRTFHKLAGAPPGRWRQASR